MFWGEEASRKTHGVCFLREKQAEKHKPEANRYVPEGKVCFWRRSKQKNTWRVSFGRRSKQKNTWRVFLEKKASRKKQNRKDKKRTRHENKERYI